MAKYSKGALVVGASISVNGATAVAVNKGDTLSSVTLTHDNGTTETITSAEVIGFQMRPLKIERGDNLIFDGKPSYKYDPTGDSFWGMVDEVAEVKAIVTKVTVDEETTVPKIIPVDLITALEVAEVEEDPG